MLGFIADTVSGLGRGLAGGGLDFEPAGRLVRAVADGHVFEVVPDPSGRRRFVAAVTPPGGTRGFLARGGEGACRSACASALASVRRGSVIAVVPCSVPADGRDALVPCAVSLARGEAGSVVLGFMPRPGSTYEVRQAFMPNFLSGTVPHVTFRDGAREVGRTVGVAALLRACVDAPGFLRPGEAAPAGWGVALAAAVEAGDGTGPDRDMDRRSVEILRERDRIERAGGTCSEGFLAMCAVAADHLTGRAEVWAALERLPQAGLIRDWAEGPRAAPAPGP